MWPANNYGMPRAASGKGLVLYLTVPLAALVNTSMYYAEGDTFQVRGIHSVLAWQG